MTRLRGRRSRLKCWLIIFGKEGALINIMIIIMMIILILLNYILIFS